MNVILQAESSECGLACLAMIAAHHRHRVGLRELRQRFPLSLKGASLPRLMSIANQLGFSSRPLRLELDEVPRLSVPCVLHWDLNHYVVLVKASARRVRIVDPARGQRDLTYEQLSKHFTGVALELHPSPETFAPRKAAPPVSILQLTGGVSGLFRSLALLLLLSGALQAFIVLAPFFLQAVVDHVLLSADRDLMFVIGLGFSLLLLLQVGTGSLRSWSVVYLSSRMSGQWMGGVFSHLLRLPLDFFEKRHLGDLISRMGSVQTIQQTLSTRFVETIVDGLMAGATLCMMLVYSRVLALISVLALLLYLALRLAMLRPVQDGTEARLSAAARQQGHLLESIRGIQSIKVARIEHVRRANYLSLLTDTINAEVGIDKLKVGFSAASQLVFGVERIAVIWLAALAVLDSTFTVGMLIAHLSYRDQFAARVGGLVDGWIELRMLRLHGERLSDVVLAAPELAAVSGPRSLPLGARIEVRGLGFRYAEGEPWILKDCSFAIGDGESVAIVGPSGCGKTTLLKLLLGLLRPTEGTITVGGQDILKLGPEIYRGLVGAVMQEEQLFAGTIAENIALSEEPPDFERIESAARLAALHVDIAAMPMGYDSLIGDMGTSLSSGQKQRVVLARALCRNPRLLFLDEATSHLDVERERMVNEAIRTLNLTRVIIAHRPETIASADRVLVLHAGRIVQDVRPEPERAVGSQTLRG